MNKFNILLVISCILSTQAYMPRVVTTTQRALASKTVNSDKNLVISSKYDKNVFSPSNTKLASTVVASAAPAETKSLAERLKVGSYFALWYIFNIGYNIYNKKSLNLAPNLTWTIGLLQLVLGLVYVLPLWLGGFRVPPKLTNEV